MMWQLAIIISAAGAIGILLYQHLHAFPATKRLFIPMFATLAMFSIGFALRLFSEQSVVDIGFYFTDISFLFVNIMFTSALILGQHKYWKIS